MPNIDTLSVQFNANGTDRAVKNIKEMAVAVRNLADGLKTLDASKLQTFASSMQTLKSSTPTKSQTERMVGFANAVTELSNAIGAANITSFAKDMQVMGEGVQAIKGRSVQGLTTAVTAMQQLSQTAQTTANSVQSAAAKMPKTDSIQGSTTTAESVRTVVAELDKVASRTDTIKQKFKGLIVPTKGFKSLEEQADKVAKKYDELREKMQKALDSGEVTAGSSAYEKMAAQLDGLRNQYDQLILKQKELALEGGAFSVNPNITKAYQGISQAVGGVKQAFGGVASVVKSANKFIDSFISKIRGFSSASKKAKSDTALLTESFKKFGKEITRVSKMLKLMIVRMALRAVIKEVGDGFKSLALHSQEFDSAMSGLINSSKTLGYSISGMAGELLNALAPVLMKIIELVTRAVNALNQLFAALRGKSAWNKAKDFTGSWSDSIKEANGAAKELKKTVLGFDELNQLQDNKSSGSGGGGGITNMFEDVPIDPWFKDLAEKIKQWANKLFEPIKNAWAKVGDWVKAKWKYALDELYKLGSSVARDFWKVWEQPETEQIFKNIFIIIGEIGRTVGNLAKRFREAWDENDTGLHILEAIRDIILIITDHLRRMATATADWADTLNFSPLLTSIQKWLESLKPAMDAVMGILEDFYNEVVLKFTKWVIESGLPALIDVFTRFNQEVKWEELRKKLGELWKHLEPFMETVGEGLIIFIDRVSQAIADFINGEKFEKFLQFIEDWMDSVTPEDAANGIEILVKAIIGLKIAGVVVGGLTALATVIGGITTACQGLATIAGAVALFASSLSGLAAAAGIVVGGIGLLKNPLFDLAGWLGASKEKVENLKKEYEGWRGTLDLVRATYLDMWYTITGQDEKLKALHNETKQLKNANGEVIKVVDLWGNTVIDFTPKIADMTKETQNAVTIIDDLNGQVKTTTDVLPKLSDNTYAASSANESIAKATEAYRKSLEDANSVHDTFKGNIEVVRQAQENSKKATDDINTSFKTFKDTTGQVTLYLKDNKPAFEQAGEAAKSAKDSVDKYMSTSRDTIKIINDNTIMLKDNKPAYEAAGEAAKSAANELKSYESSTSDVIKIIPEMTSQTKNVTGAMEDVSKSVSDTTKTIQESMTEDKWTFSGVADGLKATFEKAKDAIKGVWNSIAEKLNGEHEVGSSNIRIKLPKFASGGFPEDGLFMANRHELVGEFSNGKTAVANNAQIVEGIQAGVYNAVSRAMANTGGNDKYIVTEINVDSEKLAIAVSKGQDKQNRRYSPSMA